MVSTISAVRASFSMRLVIVEAAYRSFGRVVRDGCRCPCMASRHACLYKWLAGHQRSLIARHRPVAMNPRDRDLSWEISSTIAIVPIATSSTRATTKLHACFPTRARCMHRLHHVPRESNPGQQPRVLVRFTRSRSVLPRRVPEPG